MNSHWMVIVAGAIAAPVILAQTASDWPSYNRDLASTRYSALKQINAGNVSKLAQAWSYKLRPDANSPPAGTLNEVTPIVVNGVMYLAAGNRVVALEPDTGAEVWRYELKTGMASQRGVSYWPGDKQNPARILFLTGHKMVALNAQSGKSGYMFILDRLTGKPVFGVEERPVAQGDVPGEWYAATQPFPLKPPPLARVSISRADLVTADDTSAEHAKACQEIWDKHGFQDAGPFAPWAYQGEGAPPHETISLPGPTGG